MPDFENANIALAPFRSEGVSVRSLPWLTQHMVSGNIEAFAAKHGIGQAVGLLGLAEGERYAIRMARDRIIATGVSEENLETGWHPEGYAVTRMTSALHVFEFSGSAAMEIVARGCVANPEEPSQCAAITFAGVTVSLYRHDDRDTIRLHVDRSLARFLSRWISAQLPALAN